MCVLSRWTCVHDCVYIYICTIVSRSVGRMKVGGSQGTSPSTHTHVHTFAHTVCHVYALLCMSVPTYTQGHALTATKIKGEVVESRPNTRLEFLSCLSSPSLALFLPPSVFLSLSVTVQFQVGDVNSCHTTSANNCNHSARPPARLQQPLSPSFSLSP